MLRKLEQLNGDKPSTKSDNDLNELLINLKNSSHLLDVQNNKQLNQIAAPIKRVLEIVYFEHEDKAYSEALIEKIVLDLTKE